MKTAASWPAASGWRPRCQPASSSHLPMTAARRREHHAWRSWVEVAFGQHVSLVIVFITLLAASAMASTSSSSSTSSFHTLPHAAAGTPVDCHWPDQCLEALRLHLRAMEEIDGELAARHEQDEGKGTTSASIARMVQLHDLLNRFSDLADRTVAIVTFLTHSAPHVPPAVYDLEEAFTREVNNHTAMPVENLMQHGASLVEDGAHDYERAADFQAQAYSSQGEEEEPKPLSEEELAALLRDLYLAKLESLHLIARKVIDIKANGLTRDLLDDLYDEIDELEDIYIQEAQEQGRTTQEALLRRRRRRHYYETASDLDAWLKSILEAKEDLTDDDLAELQREVLSTMDLSDGAEREERLQKLTDVLMELWKSGKYGDSIRVVSLSTGAGAARNTSWSVSPDGVINIETMDTPHDDEGAYRTDDDEYQEEDEEDELWI